jgi:hypothetical protein
VRDEAATSAFVRALSAPATALAPVRVLATVVDSRGAPLTGVRWSAAIAFVARCRLRQAGAPADAQTRERVAQGRRPGLASLSTVVYIEKIFST